MDTNDKRRSGASGENLLGGYIIQGRSRGRARHGLCGLAFGGNGRKCRTATHERTPSDLGPGPRANLSHRFTGGYLGGQRQR